jgi:hypothetical protein
MGFPSVEDFDRSYAQASPAQRDQMLADAQWVLDMALRSGDQDGTCSCDSLDALIGTLISVTQLTLTALKHERKDPHG